MKLPRELRKHSGQSLPPALRIVDETNPAAAGDNIDSTFLGMEENAQHGAKRRGEQEPNGRPSLLSSTRMADKDGLALRFIPVRTYCTVHGNLLVLFLMTSFFCSLSWSTTRSEGARWCDGNPCRRYHSDNDRARGYSIGPSRFSTGGTESAKLKT
jgi:hypothetical protein